MLGIIQKIYSTPHFIAFSLYKSKKTQFLCLGRGGEYKSIFLIDQKIPASFRVRDRFLEYLRKYFEGVKLYRIEKIRTKVFSFVFYGRSSRGEIIFAFFYKHGKLYFIKKDQKDYFSSWQSYLGNQKSIDKNSFKELFKENDFDQVTKILSSLSEDKSETDEQIDFGKMLYLKDYKKILEKVLSKENFKEKKSHLKKIKKIESDLEKLEKFSLLEKMVLDPTIDLNLGKKGFTLLDLKFNCSSEMNHYARVSLVYDKIKKFKKASILQKSRLKTVMDAVKDTKKISFNIEKLKISSPVWALSNEEQKTKSFAKKHHNEIVSNKDISIYRFKNHHARFAIGKNASGNDFIRIHWASKDDLWFHLEGMQSAHLVLKGGLENEMLCVIASAIADFSKLTREEIPLIFAKMKYIKGLKGKRGAVRITRSRYQSVQYKKGWTEDLLLLE